MGFYNSSSPLLSPGVYHLTCWFIKIKAVPPDATGCLEFYCGGPTPLISFFSTFLQYLSAFLSPLGTDIGERPHPFSAF